MFSFPQFTRLSATRRMLMRDGRMALLDALPDGTFRALYLDAPPAAPQTATFGDLYSGRQWLLQQMFPTLSQENPNG